MESRAAPWRCLIVDDSQDFLNVAARLLERDGFTVVGLASTIVDALQLVQELGPDIALVDVYLGAESGFDFAEQLEAGGWSPRPAVVLTSTHSPEDFAELIEASPAVGFLPKVALSPDAIRDLIADRDQCDPVA